MEIAENTKFGVSEKQSFTEKRNGPARSLIIKPALNFSHSMLIYSACYLQYYEKLAGHE